MAINFDSNLLYAYYQSRNGSALLGGGVSAGAAAKKNPTPPWDSRSTAPKPTELVRSVLAGGKFVNPGAAKLDAPGSSEDYRKLFGLYQGLSALNGIADQIAGRNVGDTEKARLRARFADGLKELGAFLDTTTFEKFKVSQGVVASSAQTSVGVKRETAVYNTGVLHTGASNAEVAAFAGPVQFSMTATTQTEVGGTIITGSVKTVDFDLAEMGATPRTMSNVVLYLNGKLESEGISTRFANVRTAGLPQTVQAGGTTVTLGTAPDTYSLQIKGVASEVLAFSAPSSGPAVYLGGAAGTGASASRQIQKYETDPAAGATTNADGKVFAKTLSAEIETVRQTVTGPDGSLYVLGEANALTDGQAIKGFKDVVLSKYDSAGNLVYTRTLGAAKEAAGYALAVSADGSRVAVAGSVTGVLDAGDGGGADPNTTDSFVAIFDQEGQTVFSDRRGARAADQVDSVTFGADGSVYVAGSTGSAMAGEAASGNQDAYVRGYGVAAPGAAAAYTNKFTVQYGTAGVDRASGVAVNGSTLVVAGVENGQAILRRYDLQPTGDPVLGATRNLGAVQGDIAGVSFADDGSIVVAGTTSNGALSAGTVTTAHTSGQSVFVAKLAGDLTAGPDDRLTYYNGSRTAAGLTLAGGQVYVTGQVAVTPQPGQTTAFDGYAAAIDATTGAVSWSRQFQGADRQSAPTSIAVDATGASVLDRLGLPKGTIDYSGSAQLTAATAVRAGDQFAIRSGGGAFKTVTIETADTLKTLAEKINRALSFTAKVEVVFDKGFERLKITPLNNRTSIDIDPGKSDRDALKALGLFEGMVAATPDKARKDLPQYGLQLPSTLGLESEGRVKQAQAQLLGALSTVRSIYREATAPPETRTAVSGPVPAYLSEKIANYQRALARLGG